MTATANKIDIRKLVDEHDLHASVVGEVRQVVYTIPREVKKEGDQQGHIENIRVLVMSSAPQLFDEILRWEHTRQQELVGKLLAELPEDGDMKKIVGEKEKGGFIFRTKPIHDDIDVCIHIAR